LRSSVRRSDCCPCCRAVGVAVHISQLCAVVLDRPIFIFTSVRSWQSRITVKTRRSVSISWVRGRRLDFISRQPGLNERIAVQRLVLWACHGYRGVDCHHMSAGVDGSDETRTFAKWARLTTVQIIAYSILKTCAAATGGNLCDCGTEGVGNPTINRRSRIASGIRNAECDRFARSTSVCNSQNRCGVLCCPARNLSAANSDGVAIGVAGASGAEDSCRLTTTSRDVIDVGITSDGELGIISRRDKRIRSGRSTSADG